MSTVILYFPRSPPNERVKITESDKQSKVFEKASSWGEIARMRWIAGKANPADAITKRNASTGKLLNDMMRFGRLHVDFESGLANRDPLDL